VSEEPGASAESRLYRIEQLPLPGMLSIQPTVHTDERGRLIKLFHEEAFGAFGLPRQFTEVFVSDSRKRVVRGLHFQRPPSACGKVVTCLAGAVFDVAVDLRHGSPTFGEHAIVTLNGESATMLYLPPGLAHGFAVLGDHALMAYLATSQHNPELDDGVRWDSAGLPWPYRDPIVSERDRSLLPLSRLASPFTFDGTKGSQGSHGE